MAIERELAEESDAFPVPLNRMFRARDRMRRSGKMMKRQNDKTMNPPHNLVKH